MFYVPLVPPPPPQTNPTNPQKRPEDLSFITLKLQASEALELDGMDSVLSVPHGLFFGVPFAYIHAYIYIYISPYVYIMYAFLLVVFFSRVQV